MNLRLSVYCAIALTTSVLVRPSIYSQENADGSSATMARLQNTGSKSAGRGTTAAEAQRLLERGDSNGDGKLTKADRLPPLFAREFDTADKNSDGELDLNELRNSGLRPLSGKRFLERFDNNQDGVIKGDELHGILSPNFARLDTDNSGSLDEEEMDVLQGASYSSRATNGSNRPGNAATHAPWRNKFREGVRLRAEGKFDEAQPAFSAAAELLAAIPKDDRKADDWGYLGQALYRAGEYEEARIAFEKCNEMRGEETPTSKLRPRWWYYAMIQARTGDEDKALEYYEVMFAELKSEPSLRRANDKYRLELEEILGIEGATLPPAPARGVSQGSGGQRNDPDFQPNVDHPQFSESDSPIVAVDEGHRNFHTKYGRFLPFAKVLEADGCTVVAHQGRFTSASLQKIDILVIANAPPPSMRGASVGSAFTKREMDVVTDWVKAGGSLMLLADHHPYGEAAQQLGRAFDVEMSGGYVLDNDKDRGRIVYSRENGLLAGHSITQGLDEDKPITSVMSFTGQALKTPATFTPLMSLEEGTVRYADRRAVAANQDPQDVSDWHQGVVADIGQGRVAIFGEAGMFSAQVAGFGGKMGMNDAGAKENQQFLLNVVRWLAHRL